MVYGVAEALFNLRHGCSQHLLISYEAGPGMSFALKIIKSTSDLGFASLMRMPGSFGDRIGE